MSYKLNYGSVIQLPTDNPYGLITHELKKFHEEDFTLVMRVKSTAEDIIKEKKTDENQESCVFGRAGMHMGIFYIPNINSYKFAYWDSEDGENFDYVDIHGVTLEDEYFVTLTLSHSKKDKSFNFYIDGRKVGEKKYKKLVDYTETFIFIGVANLLENAYPHQCFWGGELEFFEIYPTTMNDVLLSKISNSDTIEDVHTHTLKTSPIISFDFDKDNSTYYSLFDKSENGNRGRINQQKINKEYNLI